MADRAGSAEQPRSGPLTGFRIVDLTRVAAGPYSTELLGFLGAEVIRVESTLRPDLFRRRVDDPNAGLEKSPRFNEMNLGKSSVTLDLSTAGGKDLLKRLVAVSDALVENFRPGVMERHGLDYERLASIKPDLVMVSISGGGRGGPESDRPGYASMFNALGGLGHLTGYADGPPTEVRDSVDLRVGLTAAFALVAALLHRARTGEGQYVDISARESIASLIGDALVAFALTGESPVRRGNHLGLLSPYDVFPCIGDDAWIAIAVGTDGEWAALCETLGRPDLKADPRFADTFLRAQHRDVIDAVLVPWTSARTVDQASYELTAGGVANSPVLGAHDLLQEPHVRERAVFRTIPHPAMGDQVVVGPPWRFRGGLPEITPSPSIGQHNRAIFMDRLGLTEAEFQELVENGAIR